MRLILICALFVWSPGSSFSQPTATWAMVYATYGFEWGTALCEDNNGNIFVSGVYTDSLSMDSIVLDPVVKGNILNRYHMLIAKINSNGVCKWVKVGKSQSYTGGIVGNITGMHFLNGFIYCVGTIAGKMAFEQDTISNGDCAVGGYGMIVLKLDLQGNYIWKKILYSGCNYNWLTNIQSVNNKLYMCGHYTDSLTLGQVKLTEPSGGFQHGFLLAIEENGNAIWAVNTGSSIANSSGESLVTDGKSLFVSGNFNDSVLAFPTVTLIGGSNFDNSTFIAKYDTSGSLLWAKGGKNVLGPGLGSPYLAINKSGLFLKAHFADSAWVAGVRYNTPPLQAREILIKTDLSGNYQWSRVFGRQNGNPFPSQICSLPSGALFYGLLSDTGAVGNSTLVANTSSDLLMIHFDDNGNKIWYKLFGGNGQEIPATVYFKSGRIIITGISSSNYTLDGIPIHTPGGKPWSHDFLLAKFYTSHVTAAVEMHSTDHHLLAVYPNPARGILNLNHHERIINIRIVDLLGNGIAFYSAEADYAKINLPRVPEGIYLIEVNSLSGTIRKKIVITR